MPNILEENFTVIQSIIDDHQNQIEADSTYQDNFTLEKNSSHNIVIGIIEGGVFFRGYKTFLDSYGMFFPEKHTEFFLCTQKQKTLQIQQSKHPSLILDSLKEVTIDSFESTDHTNNFIQNYFLSKKRSLSIIEGDMTKNDFANFVDKIVNTASNIKIEPVKEEVTEQENIEQENIEQENIEQGNATNNEELRDSE
jgi:hypothetical protein